MHVAALVWHLVLNMICNGDFAFWHVRVLNALTGLLNETGHLGICSGAVKLRFHAALLGFPT